jgi:hypothetical protein
LSSVTEILARTLDRQGQRQRLLVIDHALLVRATQIVFQEAQIEPRCLSFV